MSTTHSITRRRFLGRIAAAGAAPVLGPTIVPCSVLGAEGKVAPSNRITVGMIGLGRQALAYNLGPFVKAPDAEVTALCDVDRWRLQLDSPAAARCAKKNGFTLDALKDCFRTTDFRQVIARKDVDAVMITTPDHWHVPIALAAVRAGKDVCCEKPIGLCIAHGRILADAVAKSKRVFRTDSEFRSKPEFFKAVGLVRSGKIGQLKTIRFAAPAYKSWALPMQPTMPVPEELDYDMWLGPAPLAPYTERRVHARKDVNGNYSRPGWYGNRDYCDGGICNWGYHIADNVQWGNDSERTGPVEIEGRGEFPPIDYLHNGILGWEVHYRYASGVEAFYIDSGRAPTNQPTGIRFEGTEGSVSVVPFKKGMDGLDAEPKSLLTAKIKPEEFPYELKHEKRDFLDCVKTRARTLEDAEVGHRSTSLCQLGYVTCLTGRKLTWNPATERFAAADDANRLLQLPPGRKPWNI